MLRVCRFPLSVSIFFCVSPILAGPTAPDGDVQLRMIHNDIHLNRAIDAIEQQAGVEAATQCLNEMVQSLEELNEVLKQQPIREDDVQLRMILNDIRP